MTAQSAPRRSGFSGRLRVVAMATILTALTFIVDAAPVRLPGPLGEALGPTPTLAGYCASNASFQGRLTASSGSTAAVSRTTSATVFGYISSVVAAWSCTAYFRYSGITWNTTATTGSFQWGNLINSDAVPCNFVVGSTDFIKANATSDCPDSDAEYALSATLDAQRVYQRDAAHNSVGDFSYVHADCATYYGQKPLKTGQTFATGNTGNRPSASNCDPITIDDTGTAQTITYDATAPALAFDTPATGSTTYGSSTAFTVQFDATDAVAGFDATHTWTLTRKIATATNGSCGANATDVAAGSVVTGTTNAANQTNAQTLVNGKCYQWTLAATDANGNAGTVATSGTRLIDTVAPAADFITPDENTITNQNTAPYTVAWSESDAASGVLSRSLQRKRAVWSSGPCSGLSFTNDGGTSSAVSPVVATLATGYCYYWVQTLTDRAGNASSTNSGFVTYDTSPSADFSTPNEGTTTYQPVTSYSIAWTETAGSGSITDRSLQRQSGTIVTSGTCSGVTWANDGAASSAVSPVSATSLVNGTAYRWVQTLTNSAGKTGVSTSGCVIVDSTAPAGTIAFPETNRALAGDVDVTGEATDAGSFLDYTLDYGAGSSPGSWTTIAAVTSQVSATNPLATWSTGTLNGAYTLRLTVRDSAANTSSVTTRLVYLENAERGDESYQTRVPFDLGGGYTLDVGVSNGEARLSRDLFEIPSYGPSQSLSLSYSSLETGTAGRFGTGWTSNLTQYLTFEEDFVVWHQPDGGRVPFGDIDGTWTPLRGHFEVLGTGTGVYTITLPDQTKLTFEDSGAGRLTTVEDRFGKALTLVWSASSATATDASDRATTLAIDSVNNRITGATDSAGRAWSFGYSGTDLTTITDPASKVTTLAYDGSHHLTGVTRSRSRVSGAPETITWTVGYTSGKATSVKDPIEGAAGDANAFTYNAGSTVAAILSSPYTEAAGWHTTTYEVDALGRVTESLDHEGFTTTFGFDDDSNLTATGREVNDAATATTAWEYATGTANPTTEVKEVVDGSSVTTRMTYNATNDLLEIWEAEGTSVQRVTRHAYDGAGHLTSTNVSCTSSGTTPPTFPTACTGAGAQNADTNLITTYTYTANDQLETETDPLGRVTRHQYDSSGNETTTTENYLSGQSPTADRNVASSSAYNQVTTAGKAGLATSTTDPVGVTTTYSYDALGRQLTEVLPGDASVPALTRTTTYDELGNRLTSDESWTPLGGGSTVHRTTTHVYDLANRETNATDPAGVGVDTVFDATGAPITEVTPSVVTAISRRSDSHQVIITRSPSEQPVSTELTHDGLGNEITSMASDLVQNRTFTFTGLELSSSIPIGAGAITTTHAYDLLGQEIETIEPAGTTTNEYDRAGRLKTVTTAAGTTTYTHDRAGNQLTVTDPAGIVATTTYDALNRPIITIANDVASPTLPSEDVTTGMYYDASGTTVATTDPKGISMRTIPNVRDAAMQTIANCTDAGTTPTAAPASCTGGGTHNDVTNVVTTTTFDGSGASISSISSVGTGEDATTETADDAAGRAIAVKDPMGTISRTFYTGDQVTKTVVNCTTTGTAIPTDWVNCTGGGTANGTFNLTTTYAYDSRGNRTTEIAPNGRVTTTVPDDADRVAEVVANDVATPTLATDDVTTDYYYDEAGRQSAIASPTSTGTAQAVTRYLYDDAGRLTAEIRNCIDSPPSTPGECTGTATATADVNVVTVYAYDAKGNRVKMIAPSPAAPTGTDVTNLVPTRYAYDAENRLCRVVENSTQTDVEWAAVEAICSDNIDGTATADASTRYTYDAAGNLASMIDPNGETTTYTYDAAGRMTALGDALGQSSAWTYNDLGQQTGQTNRGDLTPLTPTISWTYDGAGRQLSRTVETAPARDSAAPAVPSGLSATVISASQVDLAWTAAADDVGVTRYTIRRNGAIVSQVSGAATSFSDFGVTGSTAYSYTVDAVDAAGNASAPSSTAAATTSAGGITNHAADAFGRTIGSGSGWGTADAGGAWTLNSNTAAGVDGASAFYSPSSSSSKLARFTSISATDLDVAFRVRVGVVPPAGSDFRIDAIGRYIDASNYYRPGLRFNAAGTITMYVTKTVGGTATHIGSSTTALPTFAAGTWIRVRARFSGTSPTTIRLRVWADGDPEPWNWGRTETDSTAALQVASQAGVRLLPSTGFSFPVTMNIDDVAITSISGDTTAPTTPTGLTATADGSSAINLAWTASTDAVGVQGYRVFRGGSYLATTGSTSWTDTGLAAATNYSYTVVALDATTNLSAQSGSAAATTGPASITTSYGYDDNGNRESATDGTLTITSAYDRLNRPLSVDDDDDDTADTTYMYSLTAPSWTDPTGTYLVALDRFDRATSVDGPYTTAFTTTYRADGQPATMAAPNGNTTTYTFDALGRETARSTRGAGPVDRAVYGLTYNRAGNVLSESSTISGDPTNGDTTYTYDPLGRLASFTRAATPTAYAWEAVPNRASVQVGAGTPVTTTYDAANRPVSDSAGGTYASDDDGRLTARPGQRLGWDNLGRLTSVRPATGSAVTATYAYDPLDRLRLVDYGSGVRVRFRYVGLTTSVAQTMDDASGSVLRHVGTGWTGERLLDWTGAGANLRFDGTNAHHDVTWLGSSAGTVSATLRYDPFGVVTSTTGASLPGFRFQGSWADSASSLSWVVARWYAPSLGRFISEDSLLGEPADPPSRHLYAYGTGEPVGRWDPDGHAPCPYGPDDCASITAASIEESNNATAQRRKEEREEQRQEQRRRRAKAKAFNTYDMVLSYIYVEMRQNSKGHRFGHWVTEVPCGRSITLECLTWEQTRKADVADNTPMLVEFYNLVNDKGIWNHKKPLKAKFANGRPFYTPIRGDSQARRIKYDIWSNIHYGYVGRSHGIPRKVLFEAQRLFDSKNTSSDDESVTIGMDLWDRNKAQLRASDIQRAILSHMARYRKFKDTENHWVVLKGWY